MTQSWNPWNSPPRITTSNGGGGLITDGDTQWMTAGGGILHIEAPPEELEAAFVAVADVPVVKGFAVGRTIFAVPAEAWLRGEMDDETSRSWRQ